MAVRAHPEGGFLTCFSHEEATSKFHLDAGRDLKNTRTVNLNLEDAGNAAAEAKQKKEQIRQYFHATFELFEHVFEPLTSDAAFTVPPVHKLRHPLIFYLGHTATFYLNKLALAGLTTRINAQFEEAFAIGVDEMSWDDLNEAHYSWPAVRDVYAYRSLLRERIDALFAQYELPLPLNQANSSADDAHTFFWAVMMGIEHERIHVETASVHVRELPLSYVRPHAFWQPCGDDAEVPANELVELAGAAGVVVGRQMSDPGYGWDCDYSAGLTMDVAPFKASKYLVSNKEFFEFVQAGGYTMQKYWDEEGWKWVSWKKPQHPWFWVPQGDGSFKLRTQTDEVALPWSWPCEVNHLEAHAFCQWKSERLGKKLRLPTEAEWLHMHDACLGGTADQWAWEKAPGNVNFEQGYASGCPINRFKQGALYDVVGNAWQHTETPVYPYQGYQVHPLYDDFSMPTFDGQHRCMKGGCWVSTGNEATRDARFAFRRHFFQFIGVRYVEGEDVDEAAHVKDCLGMDPVVDLATHRAFYPAEGDEKRPFGRVVAEFALAAFAEHAGADLPARRAMDVLCGAGLSSFLLAEKFEEVLGIDFSARLLQPAFAVRERGLAQYSVVTDAATEAREAVLFESKAQPWNATRERAFFYQSDPANLHAHLAGFALVVMFDILDQCTSYNPKAVPPHLVSRLLPGGLLVVAEPAEHHNAEAMSVEEIIAQLAPVADVVAAPVTVPLYFAETTTTGKARDFTFAVLKKKAE